MRSRRFTRVAAGLALLLAAPVWAQQDAQESTTAQPSTQAPEGFDPIERVAPFGPPAPSEKIRRVMEALEGSWRSDDQVVRFARVDLAAASDALYMERLASGRELDPLDQEIWAVYESGDGVKIRLMRAPSGSLLANRLLGSWAEPRLFPRLFPDQLDQIGDIEVEWDEEGDLRLRTDAPLDVVHAAALGVSLRIDLRDGLRTLSWTESGLDAHQERLWGGEPVTFRRWDEPDRYFFTPEGVQVVVLSEGDEPPTLEMGDSLAAYFRALLGDGRFLVDQTSRIETPTTLQTPVPYSEGFGIGLVGVRGGETRRIIVPASLTTAEVQARIAPPNVPVIYDVRVIAVRDKTRGGPAPGR